MLSVDLPEDQIQCQDCFWMGDHSELIWDEDEQAYILCPECDSTNVEEFEDI